MTSELFKSWDHLPWKGYLNPSEQWKILPTFLIGEYTFIAMSILTLFHAVRQGRHHIFVWVMSFLAGSANDIFFMVLPLVDNFWQAQATIMITPRLPLYIPCVYNIFMYCSTVTVWRLGLNRLAEACLTGFLAEMIYSPYDIIGIKFLWWTWHDTDPPISHRLLGVPVGSSLWVITFSATFSFLIRTVYLNRHRSEFLSAFVVCLLSTPLMMVQMAFLQLISMDKQGVPTVNSLLTGIIIYCIIIFTFCSKRNLMRHPVGTKIRRHYDLFLNVFLIVYYCILVGIMAVGKPENHISPGVHQTYGPCGVEQKDFSGQIRHKYVCAEDLDEDWDFNCTKIPAATEKTEWYTVCGRSHSNFHLWLGAVSFICFMGCSFYTIILKFGRRRTKKSD